MTGVHRARVDRVRGDAGVRELVGDRQGGLGERARGRGVGHLAGHRALLLTGGQEHDAPARAPVVGDAGAHRVQVVTAPRLLEVVRPVVVQEHRRAVGR